MITKAGNIYLFLAVLCLCVFRVSSLCHAQEATPTDTVKKKSFRQPIKQPVGNIIKFNPLPILWGPIPFTAEYRILREIPIGEDQSIQVGISYLGKSPFVSIAENSYNSGAGPNGTGPGNTNPNGTISLNAPELKLTISGYRLQLSHRIFLGDDLTPKGPYVGPHISYSEAFISDKYISRYQQYIRVSHFNVNYLIGYQSVLWDKVALDVFTGLGFKKNKWEENSSGLYRPMNTDDIPLYDFPIKFTLGFNVGIAFE